MAATTRDGSVDGCEAVDVVIARNAELQRLIGRRYGGLVTALDGDSQPMLLDIGQFSEHQGRLILPMDMQFLTDRQKIIGGNTLCCHAGCPPPVVLFITGMNKGYFLIPLYWDNPTM